MQCHQEQAPIYLSALPAHKLPSAASQAHTDKSKRSVQFNPVVEHASSWYDSHHISKSSFIKTFQ